MAGRLRRLAALILIIFVCLHAQFTSMLRLCGRGELGQMVVIVIIIILFGCYTALGIPNCECRAARARR